MIIIRRRFDDETNDKKFYFHISDNPFKRRNRNYSIDIKHCRDIISRPLPTRLLTLILGPLTRQFES